MLRYLIAVVCKQTLTGLVVSDDKLTLLTKHDPSTKRPYALFIDGSGATLVPGLIDMHGHVETTTVTSWEFSLPQPEASLAAYACSGVTTNIFI